MKVKPYESLTEAKIADALIEARGDIFIASQLLGVTATRLDRAIAVSPALLQAMTTSQQSISDNLKPADIRGIAERRIELYRVAGLDALHELATMPIDENSAQNQVKLAAAARLAGETGGGQVGGDLAETLRILNQEYQEKAPRLRVVRERLTIEVDPAADGTMTIDSVPERILPSE